MSETADLIELGKLARSGQARRIRTAAGLSARTVAGDVGVTVASLNRWETGKVSPNRRHAIGWLKVLRTIQASGEGEDTGE